MPTGSRWAAQPKLDGGYVHVVTDDAGRVSAVVSRRGEVLSERVHGLSDVRWLPNCIVVGELEAWTEAAQRQVARSGFSRVHLFDALRIGGIDTSSQPYGARRDALMRAESAVVNCDLDQHPGRDDLGRFAEKVPGSWRRMPVVPQLPASSWESAWSDWVERDELVEGLVFVRLDARLGARGAKRKLKRAESIDALVIDQDAKRLVLSCGALTFTVGKVRSVDAATGCVVEVACEGYYESGLPRFPRLVRVRADKSAMMVTENAARYLS